MGNKKQGNNKKNHRQSVAPQQDNAQIQQLLAQYRQIAQSLYSSRDETQAGQALTPITSLPEASQLALLKAISKETTTDAANVLLAVNILAPLKEARKEAKRSLLRLETAKIYPQWTPPIAQPTVVETNEESNTPSRFWKGLFTNTRETGEMQLVLFWEQGNHYREVRMLGFLLEFWHDGVKDAFSRTLSKRKAEDEIAYMRSNFAASGLKLVDCTLAQGRRLLLEALDVNKKYRTKPHSDYTRQLPIIRQLVLDAPEALSGDDTLPTSASLPETEDYRSVNVLDADADTDDIDAFSDADDSDLDAGELDSEYIIETFLDVWSRGDYEAAYDLLSSDSPIRDGLSQNEWVARRREWASQAQPTNAKIDIGYGFETDEEIPDNLENMPEELDGFWSLEMQDSPLSSELKELPTTTLVYKGTGRHWFWMGYTCVQEEGEWRIQSVTDKGANAQSLSKEELEQRIQAIADEVQSLAEDVAIEEIDDQEENEENLPLADFDEQLEEVIWFTKQAMHYNDARIAQSPQDYNVYNTASQQAAVVRDLERTAAYLELIAERFPEQRGDALRKLGMTLTAIVIEDKEEDEEDEEDEQYEENKPHEFQSRFAALAEKALRDAIATDNDFSSRILLAELLISQNKQVDEAERLFDQAQSLSTNPQEQAVVESGRARLARLRNQVEEALSHYQRAAEIAEDMPSIWYSIGDLQLALGREQEAEESFLHSIEVDPETMDAYAELATIYANRDDTASALDILQQGIDANPGAADLMAAQAMIHIRQDDLDRADELIHEAEEIDPDSEVVQLVSQVIHMQLAQLQTPNPISNKSKKSR